MAQSVNIPRFDLSELNLQKRIGHGNFPVFKAIKGGEAIAVKKMDCDKNEIPREVEVHSTLPPHPNVLPLLGIAHSNNGFKINICTPLADKSLYQYLHTEEKTPSLEQSTKWALQIAEGMHHIHQHGLAHRDLKSPNVLLFNNTLKVCDFGSARVLKQTTTPSGMTGTCRWMAPEFNDRATTKVNQRCDVFSYGMVLYEIFAHQLPFSDLEDEQEIFDSIHDGERPPIPLELPLHIQKLMEMCWKPTPNDRPVFKTILEALKNCEPPPSILDLEKQLHSAAQSGDAERVQSLIEDGVDVNTQTEDGKAALHLASRYGHVQVVQVLIDARVKINLQDKNGNTALLWAALEGHNTIVSLLLRANADHSICDNNGCSPLYAASQSGHTEVVDNLLNSKADPNLASTAPPCSAPLIAAALNGHLHTVVRLLERGANMNYQTNNGISPLYAASQQGHTEVVDALLKSGADPNLTVMDGASPLYAACQQGHIEVVDSLLKNGADPNLTTLDDAICSAPLGRAAEMGHLQLVVRLLEEGATINYQNKEGVTALSFATQNRHEDVVRVLLQHGALDLPRNDGVTAMTRAKAEGHTSIIAIFQEYGHTY